MASPSLPIGRFYYSFDVIPLMDLEDPTFQMKKELLCEARSVGILKDSTRQSQRTRPEARFLHPANAVSLSRRDTHTHKYTGLTHLCQKMSVAPSLSEPKTLPADPTWRHVKGRGPGAGVRRPVLGGGDAPAWPCISSRASFLTALGQPPSPVCREFSALGFFSET